jgi:hypothetical protein
MRTVRIIDWTECEKKLGNWKRYNPALDGRYHLTAQAVAALAIRGTLLDLGCGDGMLNLMARVAPLMVRVHGVDSEPNAIRLSNVGDPRAARLESFHTIGNDPQRFGQIMATCRGPLLGKTTLLYGDVGNSQVIRGKHFCRP